MAERSFSVYSFVHSCLCALSEHKHKAIVGQEAKKFCQFAGYINKEKIENQKESYYYYIKNLNCIL